MRCRMALLIGLLGAFQVPAEPQGVNFYSLDKEISLGRELAADMENRLPILRESEISDYLDRIGQQLALNAPGRYFSYSFTLIQNGGIKAAPAHGAIFPYGRKNETLLEPLAVAGGAIYIPVSVLKAVEGEAELAGVLAHSISHIALRHATRMLTRTQMTGATQQVSAALPLRFLQFARGFELNADLLAIRLMAEAGYNPLEWVRYLERLPRGSSLGNPNPQSRVEAVRKAILSLPEWTRSPGTGQFERIKTLVAGLP